MSIVTRFAVVAGLSELLAGSLSGATGPSETSGPDAVAGTGTVSSALGVGEPGCPEWGCGMNSPTRHQRGDRCDVDDRTATAPLHSSHSR